MRGIKAVDVVACNVYGHPKWDHIERGLDQWERLEPYVASGIVRLIAAGLVLGVIPFLINLAEWRA